MTNKIPENVTTEYEAVRDEILFRLKVQQDTVNYSFIAAGLLAPLLGLRSTIGLHGTLAMLLIGPLICIFLQGIYFKQHVFIELLSSYVATTLGAEDERTQKPLPFAGWEKHLTSSLYSSRITNIFSGILGAIEAGVPSLVAMAYLLSFVAVAWVSWSQLNALKFAVLLIGLLVELFMIVVVNVVLHHDDSDKSG